MLPISFTDLADSPTIVSSPHQHQFDPITSRAAHSIYYHQKSCKPLMPTRHWDHPIIMSKSTPIRANPAPKRTYDEHEDSSSNTPDLSSNTPKSSPANASSGVGTTPDTPDPPNMLDDRMMDMLPESIDQAIENVLRKALDKGKGKAIEEPQPEDKIIQPQTKKARLQEDHELFSTAVSHDTSRNQRSASMEPQIDASESNDYWSGDTSSGLVEGSADLQNPDGTWPGSSNPSRPFNCPSYDPRCSEHGSQAPKHGDAPASEDQMELD